MTNLWQPSQNLGHQMLKNSQQSCTIEYRQTHYMAMFQWTEVCNAWINLDKKCFLHI